MDETVDATKGAMETARARRSDHCGDVSAEVRRIGVAIAEMEILKAELASWKPKQPEGSAKFSNPNGADNP